MPSRRIAIALIAGWLILFAIVELSSCGGQPAGGKFGPPPEPSP